MSVYQRLVLEPLMNADDRGGGKEEAKRFGCDEIQAIFERWFFDVY